MSNRAKMNREASSAARMMSALSILNRRRLENLCLQWKPPSDHKQTEKQRKPGKFCPTFHDLSGRGAVSGVNSVTVEQKRAAKWILRATETMNQVGRAPHGKLHVFITNHHIKQKGLTLIQLRQHLLFLFLFFAKASRESPLPAPPGINRKAGTQ